MPAFEFCGDLMKYLFLGTTALVAAAIIAAPASAAERIQLELRGYHVGAISWTDLDDSGSDANEINFGSDSEIHFRGSTTLDNGLQISFKAEMELEDNSDVDGDADQIDEVYIQFDGGFGRVQFGQNDGAMDQMHLAAPRLFRRHYANDPSMDPFAPYGLRNRINSFGEFSGDDIKITYFTPQMNGLQLGFSYTPNPCKNDTGFSSCVTSEFGRNYWEIAGTWEMSLDNIEIGLSAGYGMGKQANTSQEPNELTLGANVGFGGFSFGGSYANKQTGGISSEQDHWDIGAKYETGPWSFGLSYANADGDMDWGGVEDEEYISLLAGARYMYGPGMHIGFGIQTLDFDDTGTSDDNDGLAIFVENSIVF